MIAGFLWGCLAAPFLLLFVYLLVVVSESPKEKISKVGKLYHRLFHSQEYVYAWEPMPGVGGEARNPVWVDCSCGRGWRYYTYHWQAKKDYDWPQGRDPFERRPE